MKGTHLIKRNVHFSFSFSTYNKTISSPLWQTAAPVVSKSCKQRDDHNTETDREDEKKGGEQKPEHWVTIVFFPQLAHCLRTLCYNVLSAVSAFSEQKSYRLSTTLVSTGTQCKLNNQLRHSCSTHKVTGHTWATESRQIPVQQRTGQEHQ